MYEPAERQGLWEQSLAVGRVCAMGVTTRPELGVPNIVGSSQVILDVVNLIDKVAASDCCVLIEGESGTGKELIARRLCAKSPRKDKPFIPVNCAGISESLFESQFFGHVRGAFTGAEQSMMGLVRTADEGTLFLDEVGEIPLNLQPKLLRVIQEQEVMPIGKPIPVHGEYPVYRRHEPEFARTRAAGKIPPGSLFPLEYRTRGGAATAGADRGYSAAFGSFCRSLRPALQTA